jgi:hypothetical protein
MNTCIKCGCDDAYPSLPPCPAPIVCPNPQPCAEVFDAQCVRYSLPDIICNNTIIVAQDDSIALALENIINYFCGSSSPGVMSVTGLDTDNTDPLNPIVRISVDGTSITGLGTPASPLIANSVNLQKVITTTYVLTNADNDYTIFINNGAVPVSISLGAITTANFSVGFIQEGSADVTFVGVMTNPIGLKIRGQGYQAFIERKLATATYYLLGNTKV